MPECNQSTMYEICSIHYENCVWKPIAFLYARNNVYTACCSMTAKKCDYEKRKDRWIHWVNGKWQRQHHFWSVIFFFRYVCISCASVMKFVGSEIEIWPSHKMAMVLPPQYFNRMCILCICVCHFLVGDQS